MIFKIVGKYFKYIYLDTIVHGYIIINYIYFRDFFLDLILFCKLYFLIRSGCEIIISIFWTNNFSKNCLHHVMLWKL